MQLQLISFVLILRCMEYTNCQQHASRHRQHKQSMSSGCQSGCLTCSEYNGCLSCKPRLFIFLERNGMKQTGVCLASCPSGYYGTRSPDRNDCTKCRPECDSCFTSNFCTRCRPGYYLHQGKCQQTCPEGRVPSLAQRECVPDCPADCDVCVNSDTCTRCAAGFFHLQGKCYHTCPDDYESSEQLLECIPQVHCEVDEWSEWSPCSAQERPVASSGARRREPGRFLGPPRHMETPCPVTYEKRDCVVRKKKCPGKRRTDRRNRNNRKNKENQESRHERKRERDKERKILPAGGEREDSENRNKTERRRRRGHTRSPTSMDGGTEQ